MTAIAHHHMRTRTMARYIPAPVIRLLTALGLDGLLFVEEPHHPDCTAEYGVLEVK